jgi:hypothetical protein
LLPSQLSCVGEAIHVFFVMHPACSIEQVFHFPVSCYTCTFVLSAAISNLVVNSWWIVFCHVVPLLFSSFINIFSFSLHITDTLLCLRSVISFTTFLSCSSSHPCLFSFSLGWFLVFLLLVCPILSSHSLLV